MKRLAAALAALSLVASASAQASPTQTLPRPRPMLTLDDVRTVAPALEKYAQGTLLGDLWKRPGLAPRDRSIVTLAALIARNQTIELDHYLDLALDNGVQPREISEIITHLAFYAGWANAMSAVAVAKDVFARRGIGADQLPAASPSPSRSTRPPRRDARRSSSSSSARWRRGSCSTPRTCCSATCGCGRIWRRGTGAWSPSAP